MLIRMLGACPLVLLLFSSSAQAQLGGSPFPVDFADKTPRMIFWQSEETLCDIATRPNQTGCTTTSSAPRAVFLDPALIASLSFPQKNVAEIRIDASIWDDVLFDALDNPAGGVLYQVGTASDYVLTIDTVSGVVLDYGWTAAIYSDTIISIVFVEGTLVSGGGAEAYGGNPTGTGDQLALVCGSGGLTGGPIAGECTGAHFIPNEAYDPAGGTLNYAAQNDIVPTLFPQQWSPIDIRLSEIVPGESFNLDVGFQEGLPPSTYAAASGESGDWNQIVTGTTTGLINTAGAVTSVSINVPDGSAGGIAGPTASNDTQLLLYDNLSTLGPSWSANISGLVPGDYDVFLYAPSNATVSTGDLSVNGAVLPRLSGDPAGNLMGGTSFLMVTTAATAGNIEISGSGSGFKGLAGIQLVPAPEPGGPALIATGIAVLSWLAQRRKHGRGDSHDGVPKPPIERID